MKVSIPYRDDKNNSMMRIFNENFNMFQSLIGTIKTIVVREHVNHLAKFQSLIGTIKTIQNRGGRLMVIGFNPL